MAKLQILECGIATSKSPTKNEEPPGKRTIRILEEMGKITCGPERTECEQMSHERKATKLPESLAELDLANCPVGQSQFL
jgi:hypothetical protein